MDISSIAVGSSVYGSLPSKILDCFSVSVRKRTKSKNKKILFDPTNAFSNRFSLDLKIHAVHLDEVAESLTGVKDADWPSPSDKIPFWKREFRTWDSIPEASVDIENDSDLLHVIHVTAEMAPIAKVGGLGDAVTGLARACLSRGHKVDVMIPFYECVTPPNRNGGIVGGWNYIEYHNHCIH